MQGQTIEPIEQTANLQPLWQQWKDRYVVTTDAGAAPRLRVLNGTQTATTYSEGQAYGMLFAAYLDDQPVFDGLWLYAVDHLNTNGLMHWIIQGTAVLNRGAATDADVDMANALLVACGHTRSGYWSGSPQGIDYCESAQSLIDAIWTHEIDHPGPTPSAGLPDNIGYELLPGDMWCLSCSYPQGLVNLSYFSPGYFRVFAEFTGNDGWYQVIQRNYDIAQQTQMNSCAGFVSNWNTYEGDVAPNVISGQESSYWGWDAARFAWRVAVDAYWHDDTSARGALQPIANFFSSIPAGNIRAEYNLDGTPMTNYGDTFFYANVASAMWAANTIQPAVCGQAGGQLRSNIDDVYAYLLNNDPQTYYSDSWRLLGLMLLNGQITRPLLTGSLPPTQSPATSVPSVTSTQIASPTSTPNDANTAGLQILMRSSGTQNDQQAQFQYQLTNNSPQTYSDLAVRLYFTAVDEPADVHLVDVYYDSSGTIRVNGPIAAGGSRYYYEFAYTNLTLQPGVTWEFQGNFRMNNWQPTLTLSDDWWARGTFSESYISTNYLPVYSAGQLLLGESPSG